jgi:hypothetical protein
MRSGGDLNQRRWQPGGGESLGKLGGRLNGRANVLEPLHRHDITFNFQSLSEPVVVRLGIPRFHLVTYSNGLAFLTEARRGPALTRGIICHGGILLPLRGKNG